MAKKETPKPIPKTIWIYLPDGKEEYFTEGINGVTGITTADIGDNIDYCCVYFNNKTMKEYHGFKYILECAKSYD